MNLRSLSDEILIARTKDSIREEREATTTVLHHLREIERRMLYAKLGFSSLIEYAIKELKYSESAAYRRASAMRLLKEMPKIEEKIHSGELSLAAVAQAQTHFRQTKTVSVEEKQDVLHKLENLSARACERILAEKRGETEPPERHRPLVEGKTLVTFVLDDETEVLLKEVQIELSRTLEMKLLVKEMAKLSLQVLRKRKSTSQTDCDNKAKVTRDMTDKEIKAGDADRQDKGVHGHWPMQEASVHNAPSVILTSAKQSDCKNAKSNAKPSAPSAGLATPTSVAQCNAISLDKGEARTQIQSTIKANDEAIPLPTKRAVWRIDNGRCQYREPLTGKQCECTTYIQVEHIVPRAHGGSNELENLELLCRAHNAYRAIQVFGPKHMKQFVASLR